MVSIIQIKVLSDQLIKLSEGFKNKLFGKILCIDFKDVITSKKICDLEIGELVQCRILYRKEMITVNCEII